MTDAKLRLWASSAKTGRTLDAVRLSSGWQEREITWRNLLASTGQAASTASKVDWVVWTVTSQTRGLYADGNHGFFVYDKVEGNGGATQVFNTRERSMRRPQLVITFGPG